MATLLGHGQAIAADGDLDPSFGSGGLVPTGIGREGNDVAIDSQGRILGVYTGPSGAAGVVRLMPDGSLDESFSGDGIAPVAGAVRGDALAVDASDRPIFAGRSAVSVGQSTALIARLTESGSLDTAFAGTGTREFDQVSPRRVVIREDGMILIALDGLPDEESNSFIVRRLWHDGYDDARFGDGGLATIELPAGSSDAVTLDLDVAAGGALVAVGRFRLDFEWRDAVVRLDDVGSLDPTLDVSQGGDEGPLVLPVGWTALAVDVDPLNRIVIGLGHGPPGERTGLIRLLADGTPDPGFGAGGRLIIRLDGIPGDSPRDVTIDRSGRILMSGSGSGPDTPYYFWVARASSEGALDPSFSGDGVASGPYGAGQTIALDHEGRIVMVGWGDGTPTPSPGRGLLFARFLASNDDPASEPPNGGLTGAVEASGRGLEVHRLWVPKSRTRLLSKGVRALASCELDCQIVVEIRLARRLADQLGLGGTLIGRGEALAAAGQRRWVLAKLNRRARRALGQFAGAGRLKIKVTGNPP